MVGAYIWTHRRQRGNVCKAAAAVENEIGSTVYLEEKEIHEADAGTVYREVPGQTRGGQVNVLTAELGT